MKIEKLAKIGISVGIAVGVMLLIMMSFAIPDMIERINPNYNTPKFELPSDIESVNAEFLMEQFSQLEEYTIFVERFPDHISDLQIYDTNGYLILTAFNTDINNMLELRLSWDSNNPKIEKNVDCRIGNTVDDSQIRARGSAVADYLKKTDCLE